MLKLTVDQPTNLAKALRGEGLALKMSCGGNGSCKTCRVVLGDDAVLACQTDVAAGCHEIIVSAHALQPDSFQLDMDLVVDLARDGRQPRFQRFEVSVPGPDDQPGASDVDRIRAALGQPGYSFSAEVTSEISRAEIAGGMTVSVWDDCVIDIGSRATATFAVLAIDIGTTTISCALLDANNGQVLAQAGKANAQYNYAEDLAARISFCNSRERLAEMRSLLLRDCLIPLTKELLIEAGVPARDVLTTVVSGNAPMIHILLGYDPTSMGGYPFNGVDFAPAPKEARKSGLPGKFVEFLPAHSAYFGGDVVSGLWVEQISHAKETTFFLDLGTNAEMALVHDGTCLVTAAPAGPAFEGGGLAWGIGGVEGAIDHIWAAGDRLEFSTIGGAPARGICGSGIISFVAAAFRAHGMSKSGRFRERDEIRYIQFGDQRMKAWFLTEEIYVTEEDISKFLQAKAAVFSALHSLCRQAGLQPGDLRQVYIAGNFGRYLKIEDVIEIGLLPDIDPSRVTLCGNTSLAGAAATAFDQSAASAQEDLIGNLQFIDLNGLPTFQDDFIDALFIPHRSKDLFPSVADAKKVRRRRSRSRAA